MISCDALIKFCLRHNGNGNAECPGMRGFCAHGRDVDCQLIVWLGQKGVVVRRREVQVAKIIVGGVAN